MNWSKGVWTSVGDVILYWQRPSRVTEGRKRCSNCKAWGWFVICSTSKAAPPYKTNVLIEKLKIYCWFLPWQDHYAISFETLKRLLIRHRLSYFTTGTRQFKLLVNLNDQGEPPSRIYVPPSILLVRNHRKLTRLSRGGRLLTWQRLTTQGPDQI